ncbi:flagellar protein FlaR [Bdellovibrio sp. HCB337]|uniref:flagellar protein FlaR n=1 Tax=Bdellovibrio sp. HCB337 TaxID=3394358 RepID=UPI0039A576CE
MKIAVVGNIAGGKSRLSRALSRVHSLPLTHVDSIQFLPGMKIRPLDETRKALLQVTSQDSWIIDGYGPLDLIEKRFQAADRVVFVDFPIWRHYWWCSKRQVSNLWSRREELPEDCSELTWEHTVKLYKTLWQMHTKMRPELLRIFARDNLKNKMIIVRSLSEWKTLSQQGLSL